MTDYIDAILAAIREALGKPAVYSGARHFTDQQAALAIACSPANMAAILAHIEALSAIVRSIGASHTPPVTGLPKRPL